VISEDHSGEIFRFAPLGGTAYHARLSQAERRDLPDTVVVRSSDARLLSRSTAASTWLSVWAAPGVLIRSATTAP
jgi:hypothetical protein